VQYTVCRWKVLGHWRDNLHVLSCRIVWKLHGSVQLHIVCMRPVPTLHWQDLVLKVLGWRVPGEHGRNELHHVPGREDFSFHWCLQLQHMLVWPLRPSRPVHVHPMLSRVLLWYWRKRMYRVPRRAICCHDRLLCVRRVLVRNVLRCRSRFLHSLPRWHLLDAPGFIVHKLSSRALLAKCRNLQLHNVLLWSLPAECRTGILQRTLRSWQVLQQRGFGVHKLSSR
jgi:hypothetical protein